MKTRQDFVSNSSSCSFVVNNPKNFIKKIMDKLDIKDITASLYDSMFDNIEVGIPKNSNKDDWDYYDWSSFNSFFIENAKNDFKNIKEISFMCDDYDTKAVMRLIMLYHAFKNLGFNVSCEDSERDFIDIDNSNELFYKLSIISQKNK